MAYKIVNAVEAKPGTSIVVDGVACVVKSNDVSKTGKHGHMKCRIEAIGITDNKKKVFVIGGHERLEVPLIEKRNAQVLSVTGDKASVMDLESFETLDIQIDPDVQPHMAEVVQVEYWKIGEEKIIKRKI